MKFFRAATTLMFARALQDKEEYETQGLLQVMQLTPTGDAEPVPFGSDALEDDGEHVSFDMMAHGEATLGKAAMASPSLTVPKRFEHFPDLCDAAIVKETCALLNEATPEFFGTEADRDEAVVHVAEIAVALSASRESVAEFFAKAGVQNVETNASALEKNAYAVTCESLCRKVAGSLLEDGVVPEKSDVACYRNQDSDETVCNVDVSPKALGKMSQELVSKDRPREGKGKPIEESDKETEQAMDLGDVDSLPRRTHRYLRSGIAQMFRMYPMDTGRRPASRPAALLLTVGTCKDKRPNCPEIAKNGWCASALSASWQFNQQQCPLSCGKCQPAPAVAAAGATTTTSTTTCKDKRPNCAEIAKNGWCKQQFSSSWEFNQQQCPLSCGKCGGGGPAASAPTLAPAKSDTCQYAKDGECDEPKYCPKGTDYSDCKGGGGAAVTPAPAPAPFRGTPAQKAATMLPKAQAWVSTAALKMNSGQAGDVVTRYFGSNDAATRLKVKAGINSIRNAIAAPGPYFRTNVAECNKMGALAWVMSGEKNAAGQFIINICDKAVNYGCDVCVVGTIVHEASHHPTVSTTDYCYPLADCKNLAISNPSHALKNAENFGYFLRDINGQL